MGKCFIFRGFGGERERGGSAKRENGKGKRNICGYNPKKMQLFVDFAVDESKA